jgi:hypothetical protein
MSDQQKPALEHERQAYGCTLKHSHDNAYAVLVDGDGHEQEFTENLGMIAQGAPSATLLAIHAAKRDQEARAHDKAEEAKAKRASAKAPTTPPAPETESEGE